MKLRPYQVEAVQSIWNYFENGGTGNPLICHPTGVGKSLVIAGFIKSVFERYPYQRLLMLTHVKELIEQNYDKLITYWPPAPAGIYSAGLRKRDTQSSIVFAGIGSVAKRANEFGHIDLIMIDECHLVSPNSKTMYHKFITELLKINPHLKVIGLTATPYRMGSGLLTDEGQLFTDICHDLTSMEAFNNLVDEGYLCTLVPKKTDLVYDISNVKMRGGEFVQKDLQIAVDKHELTVAAVEESIRIASDRNVWLLFTTGIEHTMHTVEVLNDYGITAKAVHSGNKDYPMTGKQRDDIIAEYKRGEFQALVNNGVLTTGFDHPPVDYIGVMRPIGSTGLWLQILGRGTRPLYESGFDLSTAEGRLAAIAASVKPNCLVGDFGANSQRLGPINDPVIPKRRKKGSGEAPVKLCEGLTKDNTICNIWVHAGLKFCPHCDNEFTFEIKLKEEASTKELIKRTKEKDEPQIASFPIDMISYSEHVKLDKPPMIKVSYYCGLRTFNEYICTEHEGYAGMRASKWWDEKIVATGEISWFRFEGGKPETTEQGLEVMDRLPVPTHIKVWLNKKFPEITERCYTGTNFGKYEESTGEVPKVEISKPIEFTADAGAGDEGVFEEWDDDIPF